MRRGARGAVAGALVVAAGLAGQGGASAAGLSAPKAAGALLQPSVDALVVFGGQEELLVLQTAYELKEGKPADALAWTIPVSAAPGDEATGAVDDGLFPTTAVLGLTQGAAPLREAIGVFEAKAVDGKGPAGVKALLGWLDAGGFAPLRDRDLRLYAGGGFAFVGVKVTAKEGKLPPKGVLHPFAVRTQTPRPYVPFKLLATAGPLDARITVLSTKPLDVSRAEKQGFVKDSKRAATVEAKDLPKVLGEVLASKLAGGLKAELEKGPISLVVLDAHQLNAGAEKAKQVESWFTDPEVSFAK